MMISENYIPAVGTRRHKVRTADTAERSLKGWWCWTMASSYWQSESVRVRENVWVLARMGWPPPVFSPIYVVSCRPFFCLAFPVSVYKKGRSAKGIKRKSYEREERWCGGLS